MRKSSRAKEGRSFAAHMKEVQYESPGRPLDLRKKGGGEVVFGTAWKKATSVAQKRLIKR